MDIEKGNIDVIFRWIPYEYVTINESDTVKRHDVFKVNRELYIENCYHAFADKSEDECINCYIYLQEIMLLGKEYKSSVFQLIYRVAERLLIYQSGNVMCKFEQLLRWREISFPLGQDIFVCCYLASRDLKWRENRRFFSWLPIIMCDNPRIIAVLKKGMAENHFHLKGSSRVFDVNWVCLMNHIDKRDREFKKMDRELLPSGGKIKNIGEELYKKCQIAALYRVYLFCVLSEEKILLRDIEEYLEDEIKLYGQIFAVQDIIDRVREGYGARVHSVINDENKFGIIEESYILDYALSRAICDYNKNSYRILAGERSFLYECFKACLVNKFSQKQQNIFYRYLKLRIIFRQELIQVNNGVGFANFSNYEKRKEYFIKNFSKYNDEFIFMAIDNQLERPYLNSLEIRVTPPKTYEELYKMVKKYYDAGSKLSGGIRDKMRIVMHFPKGRDKEKYEFLSIRNKDVRDSGKKRAMALMKFMNGRNLYSKLIVGIDACASEIGRRPGTIGQTFRYLSGREFDFEYSGDRYTELNQVSNHRQLHMTYHVGEDFFDLVDGLRAIDEAILFLGLRRGSRIGHGLAMGVDPEAYYRSKEYQILLSKQDLMDDIVWMLCVAGENGCIIDATLRMKLLQEFQNLYQDVYRDVCVDSNTESSCYQLPVNILDYYKSWKLRGDNPELYQMSWNEFRLRDDNKGSELDTWECYSFNICSEVPDELRRMNKYYQLYRLYSFDETVRERGRQMRLFKIDSEYIKLVRQLQDCMIRKLVNKGIAIETNPSSNYLIGTIKRYDQHPILRFNSRKLSKPIPNMSLSVSLNTDDQGVFDTLLENEYALMALALEKAKDKDGNKKYDIEDIYEWLNYVREMGLEQVFY